MLYNVVARRGIIAAVYEVKSHMQGAEGANLWACLALFAPQTYYRVSLPKKQEVCRILAGDAPGGEPGRRTAWHGAPCAAGKCLKKGAVATTTAPLFDYGTVSYTHLDVYKRQALYFAGGLRCTSGWQTFGVLYE